MLAVIVKNAGGPEALEFAERPTPEPTSYEVLIKVKAVGINRADILQRKGLYPPPKGASPDVLGLEYAGVVEKVGDAVSMFKVGDRVFGLSSGGTYQQYVTMHERLVAALPEKLTLTEGAAIPEAFITAFDAMVLQGGLTAGKTALVSAIGSGVGLAALQIGKCFNARVIGTSRTADKIKAAQEFGLVDGILVDNGLFADKVNATSGGADVIVELVGGTYLEEDLKCIKSKGKIVLVGMVNGSKANLNMGLLLSKRAHLIGTTLRARPIEEKIAVTQAFIQEIVPLFEKGLLKANVDKVFPVKEVGQAHSFVEANSNFGKVVIEFD